MKEEQTGTAAELIFHNETNFYTILLFETDSEQFFAVGSIPYPKAGAEYRLMGEWVNHPKYGEQFAFTSFEELPPTTTSGIAAFLASGVIKGVGPKMAASIVKAFGKDTLEVIAKTPQRLLEVSGIGEAKATAITEGYKEHTEYAQTVLALSKYEISPQICLKLYKFYGPEAVQIIEANPYTLIDDLYGYGFIKADKIAKAVGIKPDAPERIKNAIIYLMKERTAGGDTYAPQNELSEQAASMLDISRETALDFALELTVDGDLAADVIEGTKVFMLPAYYNAEKYTAAKLYNLCCTELEALAVQPENLIKDAEKKSGIYLSEKQKEAVIASCKNGVLAITGGPGTGKTTIINTILSIYQSAGINTALAAPTGRAAKRMQEATGHPALTLHRLLEYAYEEGEDRMVFGKNEEHPLDFGCIICDEVSMVDILLAQALLKAIKPGTRLILVGDADQLPPVGAGNVLKDILSCERIPFIKLTEIFRQAQESDIIVNAHKINKGEYPSWNSKDTDFFMMARGSDADIMNTIIELCKTRLPSYFNDINPYEDIQVLTPTKKGPLGSITLSAALQDALNPKDPFKDEKTIGSRIFRVGDKVMQIKNNYSLEWKNINTLMSGTGIFNGEMGIVKDINNDAGTIGILYDNEKYVTYDYLTIEEVESAFALTVHKSQGSEFPVVVMPMAKVPSMLGTRNLFYTAITRAKKAVVLVGNPAIANAMVDNQSVKKRCSGLKYRLIRLWDAFGE